MFNSGWEIKNDLRNMGGFYDCLYHRMYKICSKIRKKTK